MGSTAFFKGIFLYWFLNCLLVCLLLGNVGPGPIALTFILGAKARAKVWVKVQSIDFVIVYVVKKGVKFTTLWSTILIMFPDILFGKFFTNCFIKKIGAHTFVFKW